MSKALQDWADTEANVLAEAKRIVCDLSADPTLRVMAAHVVTLRKEHDDDARLRVQDAEYQGTMRDLLSEARIRLDQHLGMCACPGEACVSACRECNTTQDLVNRIRAFMRGQTP